MFEFVVIDTRPSFDDLNLGLFDMSDLMLLVVTMDIDGHQGRQAVPGSAPSSWATRSTGCASS